MSTEGEVRDNDTEGTDEDSQGPGSNLDLAHGSSGVQQIPDSMSNANRPSEHDGPQSGKEAVTDGCMHINTSGGTVLSRCPVAPGGS